MHAIPDVRGGEQALRASARDATGGASNIGLAICSALASRYRFDAMEAEHLATEAPSSAGYALRGHDWLLQSNQAAREIMQIDKQIVAAEIRSRDRRAGAGQPRAADRATPARSTTLSADKYTNQELYDWMVGQLSSVYFQAYQLAYDVAKRAERAFRHELGLHDSQLHPVRLLGQPASKGLLAGERLRPRPASAWRSPTSTRTGASTS